MEKFARMALLADFYGPLLTEKQRNVWDLHYQQDLSLAEIAEAENTSRQAVHDLLKRTEKILTDYEEKLGLIDRFLTEREKLQEAETLLENLIADKDHLKSLNSTFRAKLTDIRTKIHEVFEKI